MAATPAAIVSKDNANGQLNANISAAVLSIPLQSGNGANFPQPYNGTTTSGGTSTTLNCTGISATVGGAAVVEKLIWDKTDGSVAVITAVATNSITTTRLLGGTNNTWNNGDTWIIDAFVATFETVTTSSYGVLSTTVQEEALIIARTTDTLTVATGGRGYNGSTANTFSSGDYVRINVTSPVHERLKDVLSVVAQQVDTSVTNINNLVADAPFYAVDTGSASAYAVTLSPVPTAYTAGMRVHFKSTNASTAASTLNVNALGTKTIKRLDGATDLVANDIKNGQLVSCIYDGTNFQMTSPSGNAPLGLSQIGFYGDANSGAVTWSASTNLDPTSEYRYSTATLNVGQTLSVSSVNTPLVIHNSSDVTINGTMDLNGKGGAGGNHGATGSAGTAGNSLISGWTSGAGGGGSGNSGGGSGGNALSAGAAASNGSSGSGGTAGAVFPAAQLAFLANILRGICCGGGGGGGADNSNTGGTGSAGGGAMVWIIGGNLTLGASSIIRCAGTAGGNSSGGAAGGGGGGGGGTIVMIVAGTITNSGVTLSASGGGAGTGQAPGTNGGAGPAGRIVIYSLSTGNVITA